MISVIVLATENREAVEQVRERAVRSLVWLVSAVVGGVVRDVVAACPPTWPVEDVMDHAGCKLVRERKEIDRLAAAIDLVRCERVLVLRMGFQPEGPLVDEIDAAERRLASREPALLFEAPSRFVERMFPNRAPVAGVIVPRDALREKRSFAELVRAARDGIRLRTRMVPVL